MTQQISASVPTRFASGEGGLRLAQPTQAHRRNSSSVQKNHHYQLRAQSKTSTGRPNDAWQRRYPLPSSVPGSTRNFVPHVPQAALDIWVAPSRLSRADSDCDRRVVIRPLNGLIPMPLFGKASTTGHPMVIVVYDNAKDLATERFEMNEERRAQLWLGELLKEPGMMHRLKWHVLKKRPGASVEEKFDDIRQMALLGAWQRIVRAISLGQEGKIQCSNVPEQSAACDARKLDDQDTERSPDVDFVLWTAINENDKAAFQRMAKTLIYNQIGYKGADLTRKETQETIQTGPLDPETVGVTPPRRNENLIPNDYSEWNGASLIDPDLHYPNTLEEVEEREKKQSEGERLKESWLNWLQDIHDRTQDANHKRRLKACIEFENLAFVDDGEVRINNGMRAPEDDDPYLYHAILGRTHGAQQELANKHGISKSYFEKELRLMRRKYWPAWVASVIVEMK